MNNISEKFMPLLQKLKGDKKVLLILALALSGMLMISFSSSDEKDTAKKEDVSFLNAENTEKQLQNLLEEIKGAGRVRVMITYETGEENVFAKDKNEKIKDEERNESSEHIIIDEKEGENGLIIKTVYPKVRGVAVVCDGAADPIIKEQIISVVSALFDINTNNISVVNMEN